MAAVELLQRSQGVVLPGGRSFAARLVLPLRPRLPSALWRLLLGGLPELLSLRPEESRRLSTVSGLSTFDHLMLLLMAPLEARFPCHRWSQALP